MGRPSGADTFRAWLQDRNLPQAAAARVLRVTSTAVHDWLHYHRAPSHHFRDAIERWTGGAVRADAWLEEHERELLEQLRQIAPYASVDREGNGA